MKNYKKCCIICGVEKEKEELAKLLWFNVCKTCDKLPFDQKVAGVKTKQEKKS